MELIKLKINSNKEIVVKINYNQNSSTKAVIFLHGYFSGNSLGPNRLFVELEEICLKLGYYGVRYDWVGMGDSPGKISDNNFELNKNTLSCLIEFLKKQYHLRDFVFVTHSLGSSILLSHIEKIISHIRVKYIFFLSPVPISSNLFKKEFLSEFDEMKCVRKGLVLNLPFLIEIAFFNTVEMLKKIPIDSLIFYAKDDKSIDANLLKKIENTKVSVRCLKTGGHNFLSLESKSTILLEFERLLNL